MAVRDPAPDTSHPYRRLAPAEMTRTSAGADPSPRPGAALDQLSARPRCAATLRCRGYRWRGRGRYPGPAGNAGWESTARSGHGWRAAGRPGDAGQRLRGAAPTARLSSRTRRASSLATSRTSEPRSTTPRVRGGDGAGTAGEQPCTASSRATRKRQLASRAEQFWRGTGPVLPLMGDGPAHRHLRLEMPTDTAGVTAARRRCRGAAHAGWSTIP